MRFLTARAVALPRWQILLSQGYTPGGFGPPNPNNPYASTAGGYGQAPPPKKSNTLLWILGIIGGVVILGCGCCIGGSYLMFNLGMGQVGEQVKTQFQAHPAVAEHIGTIQSAEFDFTASMEETQKRQPGGGGSYLLVRVQGDKGSGDIIGTAPPGSQRLQNAVLRIPDGREFPLE